ncbi:BON domain-containing protein [Ottowia sp.]|uniref:BON domain-containing protein n=1 Tax=Ottowia sp. TaxID=1898956 RepID=UPI003A85247A
MKSMNNRWISLALCSALAGVVLSGCTAAVVGGAAAGGGLVMADRRSPQTQYADQAIELQADSRVSEALNKQGHYNVISYYRKVLLTGEVATAEDRQKAQAAVAGVPEVVGVVNELAVMPDSALSQRSSDTYVTSKVKTNLLNANGVPANSIKVVTERGTVYLMGRLTRRETELATEVARTTSGVERVVRVVDFISEQAALHPNDPYGTNATAAPVSSSGVTVPDASAVQSQATSAATNAATNAANNAANSAVNTANGSVSNASSTANSAISNANSSVNNTVNNAVNNAVVTSPVTQPTIVQQPAAQPIQVQTLPPVQ